MDLSYLEPDEFEVECATRHFDGDPMNQLTLLKLAFQNEAENSVLKPHRPHYAASRNPFREVRKCSAKLLLHREFLTNIEKLDELDQELIKKCGLRLQHVYDRLKRLSSTSKTYKTSSLHLLEKCTQLQKGVKSLQTASPNLDETINLLKEKVILPPEELSSSDDEMERASLTTAHDKNDAEDRLSTSSRHNPDRIQPLPSVVDLQQPSTSRAHQPQPSTSIPFQVGTGDNVNINPQNIGNRVSHPLSEMNRVELHQPYKVPNTISQWKVFFDGTPDGLAVERFIFRIEHLARTHNISEYKLCNELGVLLKGAASNWYWCHLERNPLITWRELRQDLTARFQDRRSDYDIQRVLDSRKQKPKESFLDFYNDILSITLQFRIIPPESEILHILRRNMRAGLQVALANQEIFSTNMLVQRCVSLEDTWVRTKYEPELLCNNRKYVNEINANTDTSIVGDNSGFENLKIHGSDQPSKSADINLTSDICALKSNSFQNVATSLGDSQRNNLKICWNCRDIGHIFFNCNKPITRIFCFGCGKDGCLKPNCYNCQGNGNPRPMNAGRLNPRTSAVPSPNTNLTLDHPNYKINDN